jgi:FMN phosphatase YigB (HAD superfamily)
MVDDRSENLATAAKLGIQTILVSDQPQDGFRVIQRLAQLPDLLES